MHAKITIDFSDGKKREYELSQQAENALIHGDHCVFRFAHPDTMEIAEIKIIRESGKVVIL